jgi:hypothetical protein
MKIPEDVREFIARHKVTWILCGLVALILALLIFDAGVSVGARRAWGPRGSKDFGPGMPIQLGLTSLVIPLPHGFIPGGHGAVGTIVGISLPHVSIKTRDGNKEQIVLENETIIRNGDSVIQAKDLQTGDNVIIIGEPNDAATTSQEIEARLIRVLPEMPTATQ